jgi:uncharacterized protein YqgQ/endogenous inhibitor of DNA gyrase (YacG/DUF329 family)
MGKRFTYICPYCNKSINYKFESHLNSHGKTLMDYYLLKFGLNSVPKCPICNKDVTIDYRNKELNETCGNRSCYQKLRVLKGNHNFKRPKVLVGVKCVLYIGYFEKEDKIKIGISKSFLDRLKLLKSHGIIFSDFYFFRTTNEIARELEISLTHKYKQYNKPLDRSLYEDQKRLMSIGYSEFYDKSILSKVLEDCKDYLKSDYVTKEEWLKLVGRDENLDLIHPKNSIRRR